MRREIKFRGKAKNGGAWLYGLIWEIDGKVYIFPKGGADSIDRYEVDPETVGQLTPFVDCYEKPIYEGDLIKDHITGVVFTIVFTDQGNFGLQADLLEFLNYEYRPIDPQYARAGFLLIGSIHDNQKGGGDES